MQMSIDGYLAGPDNELDWVVWDWDEELNNYVTELASNVDTIILGRNLAEGFIETWASKENDPDAYFFNNTQKIVFSKSLENPEWKNTRFEKRDISIAVTELKNDRGGDIIVYGGTSFVSSLINEHLIDEFYLSVNPAILGDGRTIFRGKNKHQQLILKTARSFKCGIVLLHYSIKQHD